MPNFDIILSLYKKVLDNKTVQNDQYKTYKEIIDKILKFDNNAELLKSTQQLYDSLDTSTPEALQLNSNTLRFIHMYDFMKKNCIKFECSEIISSLLKLLSEYENNSKSIQHDKLYFLKIVIMMRPVYEFLQKYKEEIEELKSIYDPIWNVKAFTFPKLLQKYSEPDELAKINLLSIRSWQIAKNTNLDLDDNSS